MVGPRRSFVAILAFAGSVLPGYPQEPFTARPAVTVAVYNFSPASSAVLGRAGGEAIRIFEDAGIELIWLECPVSEDDPRQPPDCRRQPGPTLLMLRILPRRREHDGAALSEPFGIARVNQRGGVYADLFYSGIERLGSGTELDLPRLFGSLAAHEIGHLLLGTHSHSRRGIMRALWSKNDLRQAALGWLAFSADESHRLLQNLRVRIDT